MERLPQRQLDMYKAIITDMNADELRMALLMVLNGYDIDFAVDQAMGIYQEITATRRP